jgi:hypothetical protein
VKGDCARVKAEYDPGICRVEVDCLDTWGAFQHDLFYLEAERHRRSGGMKRFSSNII